MAQPNTQAGLGHPSGAAGQPQVAQRQAPVGEKTLTPLPQRPAEGSAMHAPRAQTPVAAQNPLAGRATSSKDAPSEDDQESSDWGLAPAKSGISRENKFILFVLLVLVAVFSFVVFRNFQKKHNLAKTAAEVASKDDKSKTGKPDHKSDHQHKHDAHPSEEHAPPLQEPDAAEGHLNAEPIAGAGGGDPTADPFGNASTMEEAPPTKHRAARESRHREVSQTREEAPLHESDAPPQLHASSEETPAQPTNLFDVPAETEPTEGHVANEGQMATEHSTATEHPVMTEVAEAPPVRRGRRQTHSQPEAAEEVPAEFADPMQGVPAQIDPMHQPAEVAGIDVSEPASASDFAQTAGTAAEPIHQRGRGTAPRTGGFETAQAPVHTEVPGSVTDHMTPPTTTPRTTVPHSAGTAPRTAITPTPAPPTQPRVGSVPPPLDPADERLGGYQDAGLPPAGATHRTASRPHAPVTPSQFTPHHEPLVANVGEYVVRPNDNYWRISRKVYGTARYFAALAKHNEPNVPDPRHMKPGIKISTPAKELLEQQYGNLLPVMAASRPAGAVTHSPNAPKTPGYFVEADGQPAYRIGPSDTLSGISQKTLGRSTRWEEIYDLNKERLSEPDALSVGSILRLPPDASQTRIVGRPVEHR